MQAAFFDVDGTLASSDVVRCYFHFLRYTRPRLKLVIWSLLLIIKSPYYMLLDSLNRARFNKVFFRNYKGFLISDMERWAQEAADGYWRRQLYTDAVVQLEHHRAKGHCIVLMSGGVEPTLVPLARLLSVHVIAGAQLETVGTQFTGELRNGALSGEAKAAAVRSLSVELGLDLSTCYAYADSYADQDFLDSVGNPTAVNPDRRLRKAAKVHGWPVRNWKDHCPPVMPDKS